MELLGIVDEDFINYKKISMTLEFPKCSFKCDIEAGCEICQNSRLASIDAKNYNPNSIIESYLNNKITEAVCIQGLEPFDSFNDLLSFIALLRSKCEDDIVIYTGYYEHELVYELTQLKQFSNIVIKFGRFIPDDEKHFDPLLGINLASSNQYARYLKDINTDKL
mgnify:CR=1 FL=1